MLLFKKAELVSRRNPINSREGAVTVSHFYMESDAAIVTALKTSGFGEETDEPSFFDKTLLPCPQGTFSNSSSKGKEGCIECSPGML